MNNNEELDLILSNTKKLNIIDKEINVKKYKKLNGYDFVMHNDIHLIIEMGDLVKYADLDMSNISQAYLVKGITLYNSDDKHKYTSKVKNLLLGDIKGSFVFRINPRKHYIFHKIKSTKNKTLMDIIKNFSKYT